MRQIAIAEFGKELTILLTNSLDRSVESLIQRYSESESHKNAILEEIEWFHMKAFSSFVPLKIEYDLMLTLMANSLLRLFGAKIASGYELAQSEAIFKDIINSSARITISKDKVTVKFGKTKYSEVLGDSGLVEKDIAIPWWKNYRLHFQMS